MRISSIDNLFRKNFNFTSSKRTTYNSLDNRVYVSDCFIKRKDPIICSNYTTFFREDSEYIPFFENDWEFFAMKLADYYSQAKKVNIYDFACSDGSEAYSLVISLISSLGTIEASKFLPIKAYDKDPEIIKMAKSGEIFASFDDYKAITQASDDKPERFFDIIEERDDGYTLKAKPILTDNIIFEQKDLKDMAKQLNEPNSLIFARNMWRYLRPDEAVKIITDLRKNMDFSSRLFVGSYDLDTDAYDGKLPSFFEYAGFEISDCPGCALQKTSYYDDKEQFEYLKWILNGFLRLKSEK